MINKNMNLQMTVKTKKLNMAFFFFC
uniref:Uncharacterized protein n=1 Tax=Anguilla anguilla TaxID=7936 RepID=A0A0E9QY10_ANGAN